MAVDVGSAVGYLDLDISGFLAGLKTAQSEADAASKNIATKIGNNLSGIGKSLTSAGSTLTKSVTAPVVGLGTVAVKTSADFESAMSKVSAISGATGSDLDALNQKAQEMGAKTKFSATESAEAFTYMAMAGWKTEDMLQGIEGIMSLAAADGLDLATTSDIVTDALTAFGLSASDSGHFADVLAKAASNANTNVSLLGESFKYAAPVAGALGYSAEDTAIALGLMANAGIKGSQGGTALRSSLSRLIKPTDAAAILMEKYGLSMTNADGSMKSLGEVMDMLRNNMGDLSEAEQAQAAATLFGQEAMSGMLAIINASDSDYKKLTGAIYDAEGAAQGMADTMLNNLSGQFTLLKSALEGLAIQFGEIILPYIKQFVTWLQGLVQKLQELTPEQKEQIVKWAAFAAAIGPVLLVVGKLVTGIGGLITTLGKIPGAINTVTTGFTKLTTGLKNVGEGFALSKAGFSGLATQAGGLGTKIGSLAASIGPWGIVIAAAIAAVIAAFTSLWKNNEEFREKILAIWNQVKETFNKLCSGIVDRLNALGFDFENIGEVLSAIWKGFCDLLAPYFEGVFKYIADTFDFIVNSILNVLDFFIALFKGDWEGCWNAIKAQFENIWNAIKNWFTNILNVLKGTFDVVLGWFGTSWSECWNSIKQFFIDCWNGIVEFFNNIATTITNAVSTFISNIVTFFAELPKNIANFITNAYNSVVEWVTNMVNKAIELGTNFVNNVVNFFKELPYNIGYIIGTVLGNIVNWVTNMVAKAKELGTSFLNAIVTFFKELPGKILEFITSAWNNVVNWATNMTNKAKEVGTNFLNGIVNFFTQLPGKISGFITNAWNNVVNWGTNMANKAKTVGSDFLNNVVNSIKQLPGKISGFANTIISNLTSWAKNMLSKGKEGASNLFNSVVDGIKSLPDKILSIGKDIVTGLWNGISGAAGWLKDKVKSFATGILDGIKNALGIHSPSRVFRDEIGKMLPPGIGEGFELSLPDTMKDMKNQFNKNVDNLKGKLNNLQLSTSASVRSEDVDVSGTISKVITFDYAFFAACLAEVLRTAPIQANVNVEMQDGDVYMDKERVGRTVAPVVSRVIAQGLG